MLKLRVITALVLMAVLLPALFYPSVYPFALLATVMIMAAGWEWARMNGVDSVPARWTGAGLGLAVFAIWLSEGLAQVWPWVWGAASLLWLCLSVAMLSRGVQGWKVWPAPVRLVGGLILLGCAWLALVQAHKTGLVFLLSVLTLVWAADIAAYAGGRTFGRRKLAPTLSPGKSWEGAISGFVGVLLLSLFWWWFDRRFAGGEPSLFTRLWSLGPFVAAAAVLLLTAASVVGDLLESLVKRAAGVKDSSQLLPGHGGVLDRVDALLPVLPLAMGLAHWIGGIA